MLRYAYQGHSLTNYHTGNVAPDHAAELGRLVASMFGSSSPLHPVQSLELKTYYPGADSYSTVWSDDSSPTVVALRNIGAVEINIEVWRGMHGTGVYVRLQRPEAKDAIDPESGKPKRMVSTVWRRLEEGQHGQPACGSWVVDFSPDRDRKTRQAS